MNLFTQIAVKCKRPPPESSGGGLYIRLMRLYLLPENRLYIGVSRCDRSDVEVLDQEVEHVGGDERRQSGPELDVLDTQGQQGQQDDNRLLLVPGKDHRERQVVDAAFEGSRQGNCDLDGRVGVVALTDIQETRDAADVAEFELVEAVLAAGQGQDDRILWEFLGKFGVVVAPRFGAVAAADQEKVLDRAGLDGGDNLVGYAQHGVVAEAGQDFRSEEHTSELQSQFHLVCRLLLEKKKNIRRTVTRRSIQLCIRHPSR